MNSLVRLLQRLRAGQPRRRSSERRRRLTGRFESLETRRLLAVVASVDHEFRTDTFLMNGTFTFELSSPANSNYLDRINNGTYTGTSGEVAWTSPTDATGFFEGKAVGNGNTSFVFAGVRRSCASYTIEDIGRLDFTIDAATNDLTVDIADATSTRYTAYQNQSTPRVSQCDQDTPYTRFFGGDASLYDGTFRSNNHTVAVNYVDSGASPMNVTAPAATIQWTNNAATDLTLAAARYYPEPTIDPDWIELAQTAPTNAVSFLDPESGGVDVTAAINGKILTTSTPATPIGLVRLFWANSASDMTGAEIPVTSQGDPAGLYWNSRQVNAQITGLPTAPVGATHLRVSIAGPTGSDANAGNNNVFLPLGSFEVTNPTSGPVTAGEMFDGGSSSLLAPADAANPNIRVLAYNPETQLGGSVSVDDEFGGFVYLSPTDGPVAALREGETIQDVIEFLAIKDQTLVDRASHTITIVGVNDPPVAGDDSASVNHRALLTLPATGLLANDFDPDQGDTFELFAADELSAYGATVQVVRDPLTGQVLSIQYDPSSSLDLLGLALGEEAVDFFSYELHDAGGLSGYGLIEVTVVGISPQLSVLPIADQMLRADQPLGPLDVVLFDPDGDPSDLIVTAVSSDPTLLPPSNLTIGGAGAVRSLDAMAAAGESGRATITVQATDGARTAQFSFDVIFGSATDLDLDGVSDAIEQAGPNGGDMNQDGVGDFEQPHVVAARSAPDADYLLLVVAPPHAFENTSVVDASTAPALPSGFSLPLGFVQFELRLDAGQNAQVFFRTEQSTPPVNRLLYLTPSDAWAHGMASAGQGATLHSDRMDLALRDGGRLDADAAVDGRIVVGAGFANALRPWYNHPARLDVTNDGAIAPDDALTIINELNSIGSHALAALPPVGVTIPFFMDTDEDNFVAPADALEIINHLNSLSVGEGEASFERPFASSSAAVDAALLDPELTTPDPLAGLVLPAAPARSSLTPAPTVATAAAFGPSPPTSRLPAPVDLRSASSVADTELADSEFDAGPASADSTDPSDVSPTLDPFES